MIKEGQAKDGYLLKKIYNRSPNIVKYSLLFFFSFFELRNILVRILYRKNIFFVRRLEVEKEKKRNVSFNRS